MYLRIEGYEVEAEPDGVAALQSLERSRPDLVICDIMMPGIDGLEVCRRIKSDPATRAIPVLMFTALSGDDDVENGRAAGADLFINKPFSLVGLATVIRSYLAEDQESPVAV
jgi:CheY-like chemotaxis protein